jgi:hypothetical protein
VPQSFQEVTSEFRNNFLGGQFPFWQISHCNKFNFWSHSRMPAYIILSDTICFIIGWVILMTMLI